MKNTGDDYGYGHATRVICVVEELIKRNKFGTIFIITLAPAFLFDHLISTKHVILRRVKIDVGVIQTNAVMVDREKTIQALNQFMGSYEELILSESQWLKSMKINLVLMDAPFLPAVAAKKCNIPSIMITNFCFDYIYSSLLCINQTPIEAQLLSTVYAAYKQTTYLIKLPGETPFPSFSNHPPYFIYSVPLVVRQCTKPASQLRKELNIPLNSKVILLCFGGHQLMHQDGQTKWSLDEIFPDETWYGLVVGLDINKHHLNDESISRLKPVVRNAYMPDYINCSDVVLGKIGYGIVSEVVAHGKPLIYLKRSGWAEEEGLLQNLLIPYGSGAFEMNHEDFSKGKWKAFIEQAITQVTCKPLLRLDGAENVVSLVEDLCTKHFTHD